MRRDIFAAASSTMWFLKVPKPARRCTEDWTADDRTIDGRPAVLPRGTRGACVRRLQRHPNQRPNAFRWTRAPSDRFLCDIRQLSNNWQMSARLEASRRYRRRFRGMGRCSRPRCRFGFQSDLSELMCAKIVDETNQGPCPGWGQKAKYSRRADVSALPP